jgi:hypothetical protein
MRTSFVCAAAAVLAVAAAAPAAFGQTPLAYKYEPGQVRVYDRTVKTESEVRVGKDTRRTTMDLALQRQELVLEARAEPPGGRVLVLDMPGTDRLTTYEENGRDLLARVPEQNRARLQPPVLMVLWRDPRGEAADRPEKSTDPSQAIEMLYAETRVLPPGTLKPGDSCTREVDIGVAKAKITTKYVDQRSEGLTRCAVLSASAEVTFTGDLAQRLTIEKMTSQTTVALDGSGLIAHTGTTTLVQRAEGGEQRLTRTYLDKLVRSETLQPAQLEKARADMARVDKVIDQFKGQDLEGALTGLEKIIQENAQPTWNPALQSLHAGILQQRLLTQPVPPARLQAMLQDLKNSRDRAATQGSAAQVGQVDQVIRQVATVNLKTLLEQAGDPDPLNRDLAAFAMGFVEDAQATQRLQALVKDASAQVRGTAAMALGLQAKGLEPAALTALLKDEDVRTRGAAAFLALRTLKRGEPQAAAVLPMLMDNLKADNPLSRAQTASALAMLAPKNAVDAVAALIIAAKAEKEERLQPVYLQALKALTDLDTSTLPPYEEWLKRQPGAPAIPQTPPILPPPEKAPAKAPAETPPAETPPNAPAAAPKG